MKQYKYQILSLDGEELRSGVLTALNDEQALRRFRKKVEHYPKEGDLMECLVATTPDDMTWTFDL